jgi:hypothetical protein
MTNGAVSSAGNELTHYTYVTEKRSEVVSLHDMELHPFLTF